MSSVWIKAIGEFGAFLGLLTAGLAIGAEGLPLVGALGLSALADGPRFRLVETRAIGGDVMHRWARGATNV